MTTTERAVPVRPVDPPLPACWSRAHRPVRDEVDVALPIEGELPEGLRGVLFRNGPGKLEAFGTPYGHIFDGDGMITRFAFGGPPDRPSVRYRNRFVRTRELVTEERARRMLHRGFGTNLPGGVRRNALRLAFKNAANTSVVWHGGKLLALWEAGLPHRIDPVTLATLDRHDYDGALAGRGVVERFVTPELPFSAHPKIDPRDGALLNFGTVIGAPPRLLLHRVDRDGRLSRLRTLGLGELAFVHDFVVTPRWFVFFVPPVTFDLPRTLLGVASPAASIRERRGAPIHVLLVPRDGGPVLRLEAEHGFVFHFAGAFERKDGVIVVDGFLMDRYPQIEAPQDGARIEAQPFPPPQLVRWLIDPVRRCVMHDPLADAPGELPTTTAPPHEEHRFVWSIARRRDSATPFFTAIAKYDVRGGVRLRDFGSDFPGEPIVVRRPGGAEDDGFVLTLVYESRAERSALHVLRADDLSTIARMPLPHHVPPGFHGTWVPAAGGPDWATS